MTSTIKDKISVQNAADDAANLPKPKLGILKSESKSRLHMRVVTQVSAGEKLAGMAISDKSDTPFITVDKGVIQVRDLKLRGWRISVEKMDRALREGALLREEGSANEHREVSQHFEEADALTRMATRLVLDRIPLRGVDSSVRGWATAVSIELTYSLI